MSTPRALHGVLTGILTGALVLSVVPDAEAPMAEIIARGADLETVAAAVIDHGGTIELEIGLIDAVSADVPVDLVDELTADTRTLEVSPDGEVELLGSHDLGKHHRGLTGREAAHRLGAYDHNLDGTGIDVALVDSGIDADALPGTDVVRGVNVSFEASEDGNAGHGDGYGHGTAMAGIIAGNTRRFQGAAKDARLVDVKVADARGIADISQVLAGIDWVVSNRASDGRNIRVLSLSFGTNGTNPASTSPLAYAVEAAWRHDITVVAAGGNHGAELGRLMTPAISPHVIAVGAADLADVHNPDTLGNATVPAWSAVGSGARPVDVVAPGRSLLGGLAPDSAIAAAYPEAHEGDYLLGSGTSQATAFTAGVVAGLLELEGTLRPDDVRHLLVTTAEPVQADSGSAGAGILNLEELLDRHGIEDILDDGSDGPRPPWSDGSGSLDGDRGSFVLENGDGERLSGEHTVVGEFDREAWLDSTWTGSTWTGSTWTGSTWTGSTWTGSTWTGSTWTGSTWTGSTWTGSTWTGSTWTNVRWGE